MAMKPIYLDHCDGTYTLVNDATENVTTDTRGWRGSCLEFDKKNGTGFFAAIVYRVLAAGETLELQRSAIPNLTPADYVCWLINMSALTDVASCFVRIGTQAVDDTGATCSNYLEWTVADSALTAARWNLCKVRLGDASVTGTGVDWSNIDYIAFGVTFDGEDDALADIFVDELFFAGAEIS